MILIFLQDKSERKNLKRKFESSSSSETSCLSVSQNNNSTSSKADYFQLSWKDVLKKSSKGNLDFCVNGHIVDLTTAICDNFNANRDVTYLALELLNEYLLTIAAKLKSCTSTSKYERLLDETDSCLPVRIISAIQISSKMIDRHRVLKLKTATDLLQRMKIKITENQVLRSELQMWRRLNFSAHRPNLLNIVYCIIEMLSCKKVVVSHSEDNSQETKILDALVFHCYRYRKQLLTAFFECKKRSHFLPSNFPIHPPNVTLIAGGIVLSQMSLRGEKSVSVKIASHISSLIKIDSTSVQCMAEAILHSL